MSDAAEDPTRPPAWHEVAHLLDARFGGTASVVGARDAGAYSPASRWIARLGDGTTAFVKADRDGAAGVARDAAACGAAWGPFQPRLRAVLGPCAAGVTALVAEDLSRARWGVPLARADALALRAALDQLAAVEPGPGLHPIAERTALTAQHWPLLAADPDGTCAAGLFDAAWLDACAPRLAAAAASVDTSGDGVVHGDTWRQNWCVVPDRGAVLVDWMSAARGNPRTNHAWGECAVRACGGPAGLVLGADHPEHGAWAAWMAALATRFLVDDHAARATRPELWETQVREAHAALRWACDALDLPHPRPRPGAVPTGPWRP